MTGNKHKITRIIQETCEAFLQKLDKVFNDVPIERLNQLHAEAMRICGNIDGDVDLLTNDMHKLLSNANDLMPEAANKFATAMSSVVDASGALIDLAVDSKILVNKANEMMPGVLNNVNDAVVAGKGAVVDLAGDAKILVNNANDSMPEVVKNVNDAMGAAKGAAISVEVFAVDAKQALPQITGDVHNAAGKVADTAAGVDDLVKVTKQSLILGVQTAIFSYALYLGQGCGKVLRAVSPPLGWKPDMVDLAMPVTSTVCVWAPGMAGWSVLAGPVIVSTGVGAIAVMPLVTVCALSASCYYGRRQTTA